MNVVFFTDRDLGLKFPAILAASGLSVERHADHFAPDCPDSEWLAVVSAKGWVGLTHDKRIRYKPNELTAVVEHKAALLVVVGEAPFGELAESFVRTSERILAFIAAQERPFIGKVYRPPPAAIKANPLTPGHVELWYPKRTRPI